MKLEQIIWPYYLFVMSCLESLDYFDENNLWKDTALIVGTDHGLLGEHDWWAKNRMPLYEEISHIPLFFFILIINTLLGKEEQA